ncbi:TetR family transcriptional regulator [Amycolatopsis anabasis]|uniref:TetR family transcriptional regulator n=1 Tax=Amycolatopsis anabasis TaxID=1840409 RepID=UPI00131D8AA6|nr:TetR family transcriptional regulator [Amycolatopsis anabasis]
MTPEHRPPAPPGLTRNRPPRPTGLRQQKKQRTRTALWCSAMRLFAERGMAHTTVADIAEAAGVSERTFFRYYPSKESLITGTWRTLCENLAMLVAARPREESLLRSVSVCLPGTYVRSFDSPDIDGEIRNGMRNMMRVVSASPEMSYQINRHSFEMKHRFAELLCSRWGADVSSDPRPLALANAAQSLARESLYWWVRDTSKSITEIAREMCDATLSAGAPLQPQPLGG